jgi:hypothetical protein
MSTYLLNHNGNCKVSIVAVLVLAVFIGTTAILPPLKVKAQALVLTGNIMQPAGMPQATVCSIWTTDSDGDPKFKFDPGETVYIHWEADGMVSYMVIISSGGDSGYVDLPSSGVILFDPPFGSGVYEIRCREGEPIWIAIGTFFVIPELPFYSSLLTLATMFGVLFTMRKRHVSTRILVFKDPP